MHKTYIILVQEIGLAYGVGDHFGDWMDSSNLFLIRYFVLSSSFFFDKICVGSWFFILYQFLAIA